ncbi:hypothetical protein Tco_1110497 [Tanacetum coccineum]|uniref:PB1 domain-containing protein n=1 Tax=Tanacetum coccineum TaxID=301880 RepID=A0ABQ5IIZ9_9ASTR
MSIVRMEGQSEKALAVLVGYERCGEGGSGFERRDREQREKGERERAASESRARERRSEVASEEAHGEEREERCRHATAIGRAALSIYHLMEQIDSLAKLKWTALKSLQEVEMVNEPDTLKAEIENNREDGELPSLNHAMTTAKDITITPFKESGIKHSRRLALITKSVASPRNKGKSVKLPSFRKHDEDLDLFLVSDSEVDEPTENDEATRSEEIKITVSMEYSLRPPFVTLNIFKAVTTETELGVEADEWFNELRAMKTEGTTMTHGVLPQLRLCLRHLYLGLHGEEVKFGETLRRLIASVDGNALSLNIVMLKEKIRRLLSFGSNVVFTMTYADEDGDMVILATEDDLRDILPQSLNPLRITVNLSNGTPVGLSVGTTSAPMTLTPFQLQLQLQQKQKQLQQQFQLLCGKMGNL